MRVFLAWSGPSSRAVALALRSWLPRVLQVIEPWISDEDIEAGRRWEQIIGGELEQAKNGVLCITPQNLNSQWVHFEAGCLAKALNKAKVIPYLWSLTPAQVTGPLSMFQMVSATRDGTLAAVKSLNSSLPRPLPDEDLRQTFEKWWANLEAELGRVPLDAINAPRRTDRELLEEMLELVRQPRKEVEEIRSLGVRLEMLLEEAMLTPMQRAARAYGGSVLGKSLLQFPIAPDALDKSLSELLNRPDEPNDRSATPG